MEQVMELINETDLTKTVNFIEKKILEEEEADHLAVAFDLSEPTFRHKMYEGYKGQGVCN